ncbi:PaaI family thioesterase [Pukyongiella litopenaei]|uniref:PaaI family thioesterase n=2 Tax=Pukyongiella litopenaei TaxID=2605946 RepID=A0A2S0MUR4_9RHOB|nr:PaaI family thioesterase [Pukyongiella litopenaei]AVO39615.1 PaaI family thioesterase [Pukyongiella litopenaei]
MKDAPSLSGLQALQAMIDGGLPGPAIGRLMGFHIHKVEDGRAEFRGIPDDSVTNPAGTVHGGWYGAMLDSAMACAVMTKIPAGTTYTTLEYKVNIIRPVPLGTHVAAIGVTDHVGRSTGIAHGEIRGLDDGRLYATGSTTCIVMPMSRR